MKSSPVVYGIITSFIVATVVTAQVVHSQRKKDSGITTVTIRPFDPSFQQEQESTRLISQGYKDLQHDPVAAEKYFRQAVLLTRIPDEALAGLAASLYGQGKLNESLDAYRTLVNPSSWGSTLKSEPHLLLRYAAVSLECNQRLEAMKVYDSAVLKINKTLGSKMPLLPANVSVAPPRDKELKSMVYLALGICEWKKRQNSLALADYNRAILSNSKSAIAHFYVGEILQDMGNAVEARKSFVRASELGDNKIKDIVDALLSQRQQSRGSTR